MSMKAKLVLVIFLSLGTIDNFYGIPPQTLEKEVVEKILMALRDSQDLASSRMKYQTTYIREQITALGFNELCYAHRPLRSEKWIFESKTRYQDEFKMVGSLKLLGGNREDMYIHSIHVASSAPENFNKVLFLLGLVGLNFPDFIYMTALTQLQIFAQTQLGTHDVDLKKSIAKLPYYDDSVKLKVREACEALNLKENDKLWQELCGKLGGVRYGFEVLLAAKPS